MKIIGLTGGTGCGKTTASSILKRYGGYIIDSDAIAHEIIMQGRPAYTEIVNYFGKEILDSNDEIDRKALGNIVFSNKNKLSILTNITHEYIKIEIFDIIKRHENDSCHYIVIDAPLLIEAGLDKYCEKIIVIVADDCKRIERLTKRDNKSADQIKKIMNNQTPLDVLKQYADYIIDNSGTLSEFEAKISEIANRLKG